MNSVAARLRRPARLAKILSGVVAGQVLVQVLGVVAGLLLLRWLDVTNYAQYALAFSFASSLTILVDLGIPGSIVALVGDRRADPRVTGAYVRAARRIRNHLMRIAVPLGAVAFFFITARQDWDLLTQTALYASIAGTLYVRSNVDFFTGPLVIHGRYGWYFGTQVWVGAGRLVAQTALYTVSVLTSVTAALLTVAAGAVNGTIFRRRARPYVEEPTVTDPATIREIRGLIAPQLPSLLYVAFQGQIGVVIIAVVGATRQLAEVGALSRFAALFAALLAINGVLVAPYVARSSNGDLLRRIGLVVGGAGTAVAAVTTFAFVVPAPFLWLLGEQYDNLADETGWAVFGGALGFLASTLYSVNVARRFVWWGANNLGLALILGTQVGSAAVFDLSTTIGVQYFLTATAAAGVLSAGMILLVGLLRRHRAAVLGG